MAATNLTTTRTPTDGVSNRSVFRIRLTTIVLILLAWEAIALLGKADFLYADVVPSTWKIVAAIANEFTLAAFYHDLWITFAEHIVGFISGSLIAIALGIAMGTNPFLRQAIEPYLNAIGSTPKIIFLPIIFLFFGTGIEGKMAKGALSAFFPVVFTTTLGMMLINPVLVKVGKSFNLSHWQMVRKIYIPAMVNPVITGLRLGMAITVIGVLVAELKVASAGLGFRLSNYYEAFNIAGMYALIVIIFALAAIANIGMTRLQDRANRHLAPTAAKGKKARAKASGGLGVVATN
jgi:ABC-type nitrate/sulfonate/bicarbonate transport system permease component